MSRIKYLGYTRHYNTKKQKGDNAWRLGAFIVATPLVGINLDIWIGYHIFAFWWHPRGYGRGY